MSNFESNELKPDSSDRPGNRRKNGPTIPKISNPFANLNISRQQMMMGVGAIILLIIILTITSSLKSNSNSVPATTSGAQSIDLTVQSNPQPNQAATTQATQSAQTTQTTEQPVVSQQTEPQQITISPINQTPTDAQINPIDPNQRRVEIPGSVVDTLPQSSGTVKPEATTNKATPTASQQVPQQQVKTGQTNTNTNIHPSLASLPASNVTLQLSGASQMNSLETFAKKQNLTTYWIYETRRDNKPWFVLIYGSYTNVQEANKAIATLPTDVQAKKPWVKPIRQVHQESKQR